MEVSDIETALLDVGDPITFHDPGIGTGRTRLRSDQRAARLPPGLRSPTGDACAKGGIAGGMIASEGVTQRTAHRL